jgi:hypothetical protein
MYEPAKILDFLQHYELAAIEFSIANSLVELGAPDTKNEVEGMRLRAIELRKKLTDYLVAGEPDVPTIDLKHTAYDQMQQAASESNWMPPEYCANDWIADCCRWLREGPNVDAEPAPRPTPEQVADAMERAFSDTGEWPQGDAEVVEAWLTHGPAVMTEPRS